MKRARRIAAVVMALVLSFGLVPATAMAHTEGDPFVTDLIADGGENGFKVGEVQVWNDGDTLSVKYVITDLDWCITETHLQVAAALEGIPQKKGNPPPGQFDYKEEHECVTDYTYVIDLNGWDPGTPLYIAAHAEVQKCETEPLTLHPELTWQRSSEIGVAVYPGYGAQWTKEQGLAILLDLGTLVWDGGKVGQYFTGYSARSDISWASWECTQPGTPSTTGTDLRRFQATFDIPVGYSVTGGTLGSVNAGYEDVIPMNDNIYIFVNEELIFWGGTISIPQLDPTRAYFLGIERRDTEPQNKSAFPETDGWHMDGAIPAISSSLFVGGATNVLDVFAEELWTGGGMHELGLTLQGEQTTCETETAWGAGEDFSGKNWATYFTYVVQPVE